MLTYNMDVESRSLWRRTTPGPAALAQPYYCTEAGLFYGRAHFSTARSDKESYILFYTLAGAGLVEQRDSRVLLGPGTALLMNCRTPQSYGTAPGESCWHHYWAHVDGTGVAAAEQLLGPQRLCPVQLPPLTARAPFQSLLEKIDRADSDSIMASGLAIHGLLAALVHERLSAAAGAARSNRELVEHAADYIRAHYAEPLSLNALLADFPASRSYFLRLFRRYMGTTPYNYLLCHRITCAKEMLVLTDLPVGEIARSVGFPDSGNFSTRFTAVTGQSPLQYRRSAMQAG